MRLILSGATLGLMPALGLGAFRTFGADPPFDPEQLVGGLAFTAVYASPYLMALYIWGARPSRGHIALLSASALSFLASFSALSGVSLLLLPATVVLAWATVRAYQSAGLNPPRLALHLAAAIPPVVLVLGAFAAMLLVSDDPRCWEQTKWQDGRTEWRRITVIHAEPPLIDRSSRDIPADTTCWVTENTTRCIASHTPEGVISRGSSCTSDVIAYWEGAAALGLVAVGLVTAGGLAGRGSGGGR